jgi:hypothetical protein
MLTLDGVSGQFHNPATSSPETERQVKLKNRVGGPRVGVNGLENDFVVISRIEPRFPSCPARSVITMLIQTSKLVIG